MPLICSGGKLGLHHMNCCWTSSLLLPAFSVNVWTVPGLGPTFQLCRMGWTALDCCDWCCPRRPAALPLAHTIFIRHTNAHLYGTQQLDVNSCKVVSEQPHIKCFPLLLVPSPLWVSQWGFWWSFLSMPLERLRMESQFHIMAQKATLTACCRCERKLWGKRSGFEIVSGDLMVVMSPPGSSASALLKWGG